MAHNLPFRVSAFSARATIVRYDQRFATKARALYEFQYYAARYVADADACVLLSRDTVTLAAKSTDSDQVVYHLSFFECD